MKMVGTCKSMAGQTIKYKGDHEPDDYPSQMSNRMGKVTTQYVLHTMITQSQLSSALSNIVKSNKIFFAGADECCSNSAFAKVNTTQFA